MNDLKSRLFIGSYINPEVIYKHLNPHQIEEYFPFPVKFTSREKLHLTWKFIGDFENNKTEELIDSLNCTINSTEGINIIFEEFQIWPNLRNPEILVLKGSDSNGNATDFHRKLNENLDKLGIEKEKRSFKPHITIARFRLKDKPENRLHLPEWLVFKENEIKFKTIELIKSEINSGGSSFSTINKFYFKSKDRLF